MIWQHITEYAFLLLRIFVASACGFLIGFERKHRMKEAGIRTHVIVALGAGFFTVVSVYGFGGLSDGSRVAAQIVSGVGFLGAGMIFFRKEALHGLTTAAGVWATAGIGMAIGAGLYLVGLFATLLIIVLHVVTHAKSGFFAARRYNVIQLQLIPEDGTIEKIKEFFGIKEFFTVKINRNASDNQEVLTVHFRTQRLFFIEDLKIFLEQNPNILNLSRDEE